MEVLVASVEGTEPVGPTEASTDVGADVAGEESRVLENAQLEQPEGVRTCACRGLS